MTFFHPFILSLDFLSALILLDFYALLFYRLTFSQPYLTFFWLFFHHLTFFRKKNVWLFSTWLFFRPTWPFFRPTWPFFRPTWPFFLPTWRFPALLDFFRLRPTLLFDLFSSLDFFPKKNRLTFFHLTFIHRVRSTSRSRHGDYRIGSGVARNFFRGWGWLSSVIPPPPPATSLRIGLLQI